MMKLSQHLRIAGYTKTEFTEKFVNGSVISVQELQVYQQLNTERGFKDTIRSLANENPEHPPLYYAIARLISQLFGTSVTTIRSLSAIISLLALVCQYLAVSRIISLTPDGMGSSSASRCFPLPSAVCSRSTGV